MNHCCWECAREVDDADLHTSDADGHWRDYCAGCCPDCTATGQLRGQLDIFGNEVA